MGWKTNEKEIENRVKRCDSSQQLSLPVRLEDNNDGALVPSVILFLLLLKLSQDGDEGVRLAETSPSSGAISTLAFSLHNANPFLSNASPRSKERQTGS